MSYGAWAEALSWWIFQSSGCSFLYWTASWRHQGTWMVPCIICWQLVHGEHTHDKLCPSSKKKLTPPLYCFLIALIFTHTDCFFGHWNCDVFHWDGCLCFRVITVERQFYNISSYDILINLVSSFAYSSTHSMQTIFFLFMNENGIYIQWKLSHH